MGVIAAAVTAQVTAVAAAAAAGEGKVECAVGVGIEVGRRRGRDTQPLIKGKSLACIHPYKGGEGGRKGRREGGHAAAAAVPCS